MSTEINIKKKLAILDEGVSVTTDATSIDFVGAGVTAATVDGDVTITIPGGVGSVTATAPIQSSGGTTPDISITQASAIADGYLSSTNFAIFNAKVGGSGTINYVSKFTGTGTLGNSNIFDNGTNVGIGTITPAKLLDVNGDALINGHTVGRGGGNVATNTVAGLQAGFANTTGSSNSFFGSSSGRFNTTGINLSSIGVASLYNNTTGSDNVGIGLHTLFSNVTGSNNTSAGNFAGRYLNNGTTANTTPENSVFLGYNTRALTNNDTNQIVIGYQALGKGSNTVQLGNTSITNTYLQGSVTVNNAFSLPTVAPTSGQVLGYLGAGTTTWVSAGASGIVGIANSSGVYTYYATLTLAMTAAVSGNTIELFADITETGSVAITLKSGVKINGNGHTYTLSVNDNTHALICSVTVELFNWKVVRTGRANGSGGLVLSCAGGTLRAQGVIMQNTYGTAVIDGVAIYGLNAIGYYTGLALQYEATRLYDCIGESTGLGSGIESAYTVNCIGIAISGAGIAGNGTHLNSTGISTSGSGLTGQTFTGCIGISTSGTGVEATVQGRNCIGISTSGIGGTGIFYESTLISSSNYGCQATIYSSYTHSVSSVATNSSSIYNSTVRCLWDNAAGHCTSTNALGPREILNSFLEVTNASAYCLTGYVGSTWKYASNVYKGSTTAVNSTNIIQGITNTSDNQGNILI